MQGDEFAPSRDGARPWAFAALAGSVLGTAIQLQQAALWGWACYAALLIAGMAGLAVLWRFSRRQGPVAQWARAVPLIALIALVLGAAVGAAVAGLRAAATLEDALSPALEGRDLSVVGVVTQMPQRIDGGLRLRLAVESARMADASQASVRLPPILLLGWYGDAGFSFGSSSSGSRGTAALLANLANPPHAGERWRMTVRLKAPHGNLNPHGFDYELWLWEQGVRATGYVRTGARDAVPERLGATWQYPIEGARETVRDAIFARVPDARDAGVVAALATGDQSAIDRADWDVFRVTGVAHLMAISGVHVTMFAWLAGAAIAWLWRRSPALMLRWPAQRAALVGGVLSAALYALFSGWGVPSQRTVLMLGTVALLRLSGLRWPWLHVLLCACAAVVAIDPWALTQAGFWLSFVAVGVLFAADSAFNGKVQRSGLGSRAIGLFREQWIVTLALAPLTLLLFHQVSVVGLLANLVAIPWVTLVVTPLSLLGVLAPPLWHAAAAAVGLLGTLLQWLAGLPWASVSLPASPVWAGACGVAGGLLLAMRLPWTVRLQGFVLLLPVLLWQTPRPAADEFELLAADIGQGSAVLVRTATHSLLFDAGPRYSPVSDAGQRVVVPLLRALGERLDAVVLSHRDSDHTGGAAAVLAAQPQAQVLGSSQAGDSPRPVHRCVAGEHWTWDGVHFEFLHPLETDYARTGLTANALSCVLRIGNGRAAALLTGDIERAQEAALVRRTEQNALEADVLLVPHHGSKSSSSQELLDAVHPRIAWAQAGYRNRFGHPAAVVRERYVRSGVDFVDSPRCGAIRWRSEQPRQWLCERDVARRYWHHEVPALDTQRGNSS